MNTMEPTSSEVAQVAVDRPAPSLHDSLEIGPTKPAVPPSASFPNPAIQIKGARQGLLMVVREDATLTEVLDGIRTKFATEDSFLAGASLFLDLGWREADVDFFIAIEDAFREHSLQLAGVLSTSLTARESAHKRGHKAMIGRLGLAGHHGRRLKEKRVASESVAPSVPLPAVDQKATAMAPFFDQMLTMAAPVPELGRPDITLESILKQPTLGSGPSVSADAESESEEPESEATLYIRRTLRSGVKAMYSGNIVVMGDVNPGAELEADGDIIVVGNLRGKAHAGASGNPKAQIFALSLQPIQIRIGEEIWSGGEPANRLKSSGPQRAILKDGKIAFVSAS